MKLNISKQDLSTGAITEEHKLFFGQVFRGQSAYQYAVESGLFSGTEEEFAEYLGNIGNVSEDVNQALEDLEKTKNDFVQKDGVYKSLSVGGYVGQEGGELEGEIRDGSLNDIGGISTPSAPRTYLFVDISHLAGVGKIAVKTTNNNAYSRLWALWKTPTAENGSNRLLSAR